MKNLHAVLTMLAFFLIVTFAHGQATPDDAAPAVDPAKKAEIEKLLQLTGTAKLVQQMMDQMLSNFKAHETGVPQKFWDRFAKEINTQDLLDKMMSIYDKYYSLDDLKAVNAFYSTPTGQRLLASLPQISRESMQVGQEWGRGVGMRVAAEIQAEKAKNGSSNPAPSASAPDSTPHN